MTEWWFLVKNLPFFNPLKLNAILDSTSGCKAGNLDFFITWIMRTPQDECTATFLPWKIGL